VKDLLVEKSLSLMILEDSQKGVVVPDLSEYNVSTSDELIKLISIGNSRRTMAATTVNQFSSRSHAILQVSIEQKGNDEVIQSKFLLVDLAGSERGGFEKGIRSQEGGNINKSLLSLCNCINILSDKNKKNSFVPYRDSKLTRLLKDSLGGNISTAMIACVSPSPLSYEETINTLKYATRAMVIQKKLTRGVIKDPGAQISQYKEVIDSLKEEIEQLKSVIRSQQGGSVNNSTREISQRKNESISERASLKALPDLLKYKKVVNTLSTFTMDQLDKYIDEYITH
jgi:kinesin family protein 18/19